MLLINVNAATGLINVARQKDMPKACGEEDYRVKLINKKKSAGRSCDVICYDVTSYGSLSK